MRIIFIPQIYKNVSFGSRIKRHNFADLQRLVYRETGLGYFHTKVYTLKGKS
jgi:hypothetical protein